MLRYHHGDLRRAVLDASLALIAEQGAAALSLREAARLAGVTHGAPYHHFPDKAALLAAIAQEGFELLSKEMATAVAAAQARPDARLAAAGRAYVRFALRHPAHFRVMFRPELWQPAQHTQAARAGDASHAQLVALVDECRRHGLGTSIARDTLMLLAWSTVHGLASLALDGPLTKDARASSEQLAAKVTSALTKLLRR
jgi:AcrR family transcriptional regulator